MIRLLVFGMFFLIIGACNSSKKSGSTIKVIPDDAAIDSADYFSKDYTVTHLSNEERIKGRWAVELMYRIPGSTPDKLNGVFLSFTNPQFQGKGPCNNISGNYAIKDFNISFSETITTKMACPYLEQESAYVTLLLTMVDKFTFVEKKLLLKNKNGNVVFECVQRE